MAVQIEVGPEAVTGTPAEHGAVSVGRDVAYVRLGIVNIVLLGPSGAGDRGWVLVDAGLLGTAGRIRRIAGARFGEDARPSAIVLTHGHFDHVGALEELSADWDAPVFAHGDEHPYLTGAHAYPPADPGAGGGLMTLLSPFFPRGPIDVSGRLAALPADGGVPGAPGWSWIHTPGHTPGHVSLWRAETRTLVAGDAVITTGQESAYEVALQKPELHGPPRYFTPDWGRAETSAQRLAALDPEVIVSGHGPALAGPPMRRALGELARNFREVATP